MERKHAIIPIVIAIAFLLINRLLGVFTSFQFLPLGISIDMGPIKITAEGIEGIILACGAAMALIIYAKAE